MVQQTRGSWGYKSQEVGCSRNGTGFQLATLPGALGQRGSKLGTRPFRRVVGRPACWCSSETLGSNSERTIFFFLFERDVVCRPSKRTCRKVVGSTCPRKLVQHTQGMSVQQTQGRRPNKPEEVGATNHRKLAVVTTELVVSWRRSRARSGNPGQDFAQDRLGGW